MTPAAPILYDLYTEIRQDPQLIHPGLEEYYLLLRLLDSGYPISSFDQLAFTIETLWLKSQAQKPRFRSILEKRRTDLQSFLNYLIATSGSTDPITKEPLKTDPVIDKKDPLPVTPVPGTPVGEPVPRTITQPAVANTEEPERMMEDEKTNFSVEAAEPGTQSNIYVDSGKPKARGLTDIPFTYTHDYFPVHNRHLRQAWRTLKDNCETGSSAEIDFERTVTFISQQGYFSTVQFKKIIQNQLKLFLFIDRSDSMVIAEEFGRELANTAIQSGIHEKLVPLYFFETPQKDIPHDDHILTGEDWSPFRLKKLFSGLNKKNIVVMIYSDAGALKNNYDHDRINKTLAFIDQLHNLAAYVAWVNPAPKSRWPGTNAELINNNIPMFETERSAVVSAISVLKGKAPVSV